MNKKINTTKVLSLIVIILLVLSVYQFVQLSRLNKKLDTLEKVVSQIEEGSYAIDQHVQELDLQLRSK
jgi:peptidoglycan hydrolase CwlO-like protein